MSSQLSPHDLALKATCSAKRPHLKAVDNERAARDIASSALKGLKNAAKALSVDIETFHAAKMYGDPLAKGFIASAAHYAHFLILDPYNQLRSQLEKYRRNDKTLSKRMDEMRLAITLLGDSLQSLIDRGATVKKFDVYPPEGGSQVPTACPFELLHRLLCDSPVMREALATGTDTETLLSLEFRKVFRPYLGGIQERSPAGCPNMVFATIHRSPKAVQVVFGGNEVAWPNVETCPEIWAITKAARDYQLSAYIPIAQQAFNALERRELFRMRERKDDINELNQKAILFQERTDAIKWLRQHPTHLGPKSLMRFKIQSFSYEGKP
ncbi:hypothetical protein BC567DRAFT_266599 [Phyllosticta citribraziliensis]